MPSRAQLKKDLKVLEAVMEAETGIAARNLGLSVDALRGQLFRIRKRVSECQKYLNNIYALQRKSARIRKFTTSGALPESVDDMEDY